MDFKLWIVLLALGACAPAAFGGCSLPSAPSKLPRAATANDSEMRSAMRTLKQYDLDVTAYLKCLSFEAKQGRLSALESARLQNIALEKLEKATKLFNEQMRIYLGR